MNFTEILLRNGFELPKGGYTKEDPRGSEYGFYSVGIEALPTGMPGVKVFKFDKHRVIQWVCMFDSPFMFEDWIKDTL